MAKERLIGYYGKYATAALGADVITGTLKDESYYVVVTVGGTSTLPAGLEAGYVFVADGTENITASDDVVKEIVMTDLCDVQTWGLEFSAAEVDVTALCDSSNVYLTGRTDITGSMEGVYTIGVTDKKSGVANAFFDIVRQAGAGGAITIDKIDSDPIVAILYKQKDKTAGETEQFYIAPASITSFSDSVTGSDAQAFSSSFRIAPSNDIKFQLVSIVRS